MSTSEAHDFTNPQDSEWDADKCNQDDSPSQDDDMREVEVSGSDADEEIYKNKPNVLFYLDLIPSDPRGDKISVIHDSWSFDKLESHHGFIQWLFPLYEGPGVNWKAYALTSNEAKIMRNNRDIGKRIVQSYETMLSFYGMMLVNKKSGEVQRNPQTWKTRYRNLDQNTHNNLRISRILASLGHLGFWRWKVEWINFLENEIVDQKRLTRCRQSFTNFWLPLRLITNLDPEEYEDNIYYQENFATLPQ